MIRLLPFLVCSVLLLFVHACSDQTTSPTAPSSPPVSVDASPAPAPPPDVRPGVLRTLSPGGTGSRPDSSRFNAYDFSASWDGEVLTLSLREDEMRSMREASKPHRERWVWLGTCSSEPQHLAQWCPEPIGAFGPLAISGLVTGLLVDLDSCDGWIIVQADELSDDHSNGWRNAPCPDPDGSAVTSDGRNWDVPAPSTSPRGLRPELYRQLVYGAQSPSIGTPYRPLSHSWVLGRERIADLNVAFSEFPMHANQRSLSTAPAIRDARVPLDCTLPSGLFEQVRTLTPMLVQAAAGVAHRGRIVRARSADHASRLVREGWLVVEFERTPSSGTVLGYAAIAGAAVNAGVIRFSIDGGCNLAAENFARTFAHEFGHALGFFHVTDTHWLMYPLNLTFAHVPGAAFDPDEAHHMRTAVAFGPGYPSAAEPWLESRSPDPEVRRNVRRDLLIAVD